MRSKWLKSALVIVIALLFFAPPAWAKSKGYCFVVGYSYKLKRVYTTPVFMVKVRKISHSETEYATDIALIRKMEAQFQDHLANTAGEDPGRFTIVARGAYRKQSLAEQSQTREIENYAKNKFAVFDLKAFKYKK